MFTKNYLKLFVQYLVSSRNLRNKNNPQSTKVFIFNKRGANFQKIVQYLTNCFFFRRINQFCLFVGFRPPLYPFDRFFLRVNFFWNGEQYQNEKMSAFIHGGTVLGCYCYLPNLGGLKLNFSSLRKVQR